jgi:hypothetical protein
MERACVSEREYNLSFSQSPIKCLTVVTGYRDRSTRKVVELAGS